MAVPQIVVIACLLAWDRPGTPTSNSRSPFSSSHRLLKNPRGEAIFYNATGTTLYVLGMLVAAFALRPLIQGQV